LGYTKDINNDVWCFFYLVFSLQESHGG